MRLALLHGQTLQAFLSSACRTHWGREVEPVIKGMEIEAAFGVIQ